MRQKRLIKQTAVLGLSGLMGILIPITALAVSPEFARTAEEWAALQDNVLDYSEIADLIHEYNVTVQNNQYELNKFKKDYGNTKDDIATSYRQLADDLEASMSGEDGVGMISDLQLELQAKQLREQADDNIEDSQIYYLSYSQAEDNLVLSAQTKYISYYKTQLELDSARIEKTRLESVYSLAAVQQQAGITTQTQVLDAQMAVLKQEKTIANLEQEIENIRQSLIVMLGWKGSDQPEITGVDKVDFDKIAAIDLEADKSAAIENNYTLKINQRKLENALDTDNKQSIQTTINSNQRQIGVSVTTAYQNLLTAKLSYEQSVADVETASRNMSVIQQKWNAGMATKYEYEQQQATLSMKEIAVQIDEFSLLESWETYQWTVNGLASAG